MSGAWSADRPRLTRSTAATASYFNLTIEDGQLTDPGAPAAPADPGAPAAPADPGAPAAPADGAGQDWLPRQDGLVTLLRRQPRRLLIVAATALLLAGCSTGPPGGAPTPTPPPSTPPAAGALTPSPALVTMGVQVSPELAAAPFDQARQVQAPAGWTVSVWARTDAPRLAVWAPDGRLLVSRPQVGDVVALAPQASAAAPIITTLVAGLSQPHGLAFRDQTLYVAESNQVDTYAYHDGTLGNRNVVVAGLPDAKSPDLHGAYAHALKSVALGHDGAIYVSVGSTGNLSVADRNASPPRAAILRSPAGGGSPTPFAVGVRNGTGLAVAPDGSVWTAVNNRDNIAYPYDKPFNAGSRSSALGKVITSYVNDHPLEALARLTTGRDLGWPWCNPDPDVTPGAPDTAFSYSNRPFVRDIQTNADGGSLDCSRLPPVEQGLPAHSAPLGLSFATSPGLPAPFGKGALVGVHGSWNREPPRAPEVAFFPWRSGTLGAQQTLLSGFQAGDGSRWGRPVMAVQGPDRAIYVTDDLAGAIYRMVPPRR